MGAEAASCFNAMARLMPVVRAEAARRLLAAGLRQERVAEHLAVSQAMVSKYARSKGGREPVLPARVLATLIEATVDGALADESAGRVSAWCRLCTSLSDTGLASRSAPWPGLAECARGDEAASDAEASSVLSQLVQAEQRIRRLPFGRLLPQVRSNLAMALPSSRSSRDVAAFPGRFTEVRGETRAASPPEFGASTHLADLLLKLRRTAPQQRAILNIRHDEGVRRAARLAGLRLRSLRRSRGDLVLSVRDGESVDVLVDPGAFGIEPTLYLVGPSAAEVVQKAERILSHLSKEHAR